ncbi:MAG: methyltransferase domain-containing protein [Methanoregula sp.]|jgi:cobalt-precorrin-6B (C15)-methyltransferase|nr:methyltransferase domain-containing protein [Methanoregula sp.]
MPQPKLAGGPTQDEILAVSLFKLDLRNTDTVLEIGCGTGKVSVAAARATRRVTAIDRRPEAIAIAKDTAGEAGVHNIDFFCTEALGFLEDGDCWDCAFLGGTKQLGEILPILAKKVRRTIVINAVLLSTLNEAVTTMQRLGIFEGVVHVQVTRSHNLAGSIMFKPIDPVYVIVGRGTAC